MCGSWPAILRERTRRRRRQAREIARFSDDESWSATGQETSSAGRRIRGAGAYSARTRGRDAQPRAETDLLRLQHISGSASLRHAWLLLSRSGATRFHREDSSKPSVRLEGTPDEAAAPG